jgi:hypothetical protein
MAEFSVKNLAAHLDHRHTIISLGDRKEFMLAWTSLQSVFEYRAFHAKCLDKVFSDSEAGKAHQAIIDRCNEVIMQVLAIEQQQTNSGQ